MTSDRLDWHFWNWALWQRGSFAGAVLELWYPPSASGGMGVSHSSDFDAMVETADDRCARAVESTLDDCSVAERCAVHHVWLHAVFRPRVGLDAAYSAARRKVGDGLVRRGII